MGQNLDAKVAQLTEAAKANFIGEAVDHLRADVNALTQKSNDLRAQADEAAAKAAEIQREIDEVENPAPDNVVAEGAPSAEAPVPQTEG